MYRAAACKYVRSSTGSIGTAASFKRAMGAKHVADESPGSPMTFGVLCEIQILSHVEYRNIITVSVADDGCREKMRKVSVYTAGPCTAMATLVQYCTVEAKPCTFAETA